VRSDEEENKKNKSRGGRERGIEGGVIKPVEGQRHISSG
jgi:hypothetical protein